MINIFLTTLSVFCCLELILVAMQLNKEIKAQTEKIKLLQQSQKQTQEDLGALNEK